MNNKLYILCTLFTGSLIANEPATENYTASNLTKPCIVNEEKNKDPNAGHFLLGMAFGNYTNLNDQYHTQNEPDHYHTQEITSKQQKKRPVLVGTWLLGYQSKISKTDVFQSLAAELEFCHDFVKPRITGVHYWNADKQFRIFSGAGTNLTMFGPENRLGPSLSSGVEFGNPSNAISIFRLNYDLGILPVGFSHYYGLQNSDNNYQSLSLSFIAGF